MSQSYVSSRALRHICLGNAFTRVRFAPSPTGPLHIGGLRTALVNFMVAKSNGGKFILRIEDTDKSRCTNAALEDIIVSLKWAGLLPNEGPFSGGQSGPYIQSERTEIYRNYADNLISKGHAYPCFCSPGRLELLKNEQRRRGEIIRYDNRCRHLSQRQVDKLLSQNKQHVLRLKMTPSNVLHKDLVFGDVRFDNIELDGDPVILKSDGFPVYHLANVIDDHLMNITHVIRGSEWITSVPKHIQLYEAFGWEPPLFAHLPLMLSSSGQKFSKRLSDQEPFGLVRNLRSAGYAPSAVLTWLAGTGGIFSLPDQKTSDVVSWSPDKRIDELLPYFDLSSLSRHHARVNLDLLQICGREHLDRLIDEALKHRGDLANNPPAIVSLIKEFVSLDQQGRCESIPELPRDGKKFAELLGRLKGRLCRFSDLTSEFGFLWHQPDANELKTNLPARDKEVSHALECLACLLSSVGEASENELKDLLNRLCKKTPLKKPLLMKAFRISLTGHPTGMPVHEIIGILSSSESSNRLLKAATSISEK